MALILIGGLAVLVDEWDAICIGWTGETMELRCECAACGARFKIDGKYAGQKVKCPKCAGVMTAEDAGSQRLQSPGAPGSEVGSQRSEVGIQRSAAGPGSASTTPGPPVRPPAAKPAAPRSAAPPANAPPASAPPPRNAPPVRPPAPAGSSSINTASDSYAGGSSIHSGGSYGAGHSSGSSFSIAASASRAGAAGESASKSSVRPVKRGQDSRLGLLISGAAVLLLLVAGTIGLVVLVRNADDAGETAGQNAADAQAELVVVWPAEERAGAKLRIDGRPHTVPENGEVRIRISPGTHAVMLTRLGYDDVETTVDLTPGEQQSFTPQWKELGALAQGSAKGIGSAAGAATPLGYEEWLQDFEQARRQAAQDNKSIFLAFVQSDADASSDRLMRDVFQTPFFAELRKTQITPVLVDFPATRERVAQVASPAQNQALDERFHVGGRLPTVVLTDAEGLPFAIERGYDESGAHRMRDLPALLGERTERDRLLAQVSSSTGEDKLVAAVAAAEWFDERDLSFAYATHLRDWLALGEQLDPQNEEGQYEALFGVEWTARVQSILHDAPQQAPALVAELEGWKQNRTFHSADRAAQLHFFAACVSLELEKSDDAARWVRDALAYDPEDEQLHAILAALDQRLNGEAGTGTGFVVAAGGYVLTNYHVIEGPGKVMVRLPDGEDAPAQIVAQDAEQDMALLRIDHPDVAALAALSVSETATGRGVEVAAFGYPLGDEISAGLKLTKGVISGIPKGGRDNMLILDCRINPGNSGGPLCDASGEVVGMVTAKSVGFIGVDSYGMALPADTLRGFLKQHVPAGRVASTTGLAGAATGSAVESAPPARAAPRGADLNWSQVDSKVSPSVLMVLKMQR